jgi:hypothetical protein
MTLPEALLAVWQQVLMDEKPAVELEGETYPVRRTRSRKLRVVDFAFGGHQFVGLEQNPDTRSRWAKLARQGKRIMQFTDEKGYVANVCDGRLNRYPAWERLRLD